LGVAKTPTKKGTTVNNKYQKNMPKTSTGPGLAVPDAVPIAMGEIAEDMREGLLALAVGAGLQVMASLMEPSAANWQMWVDLSEERPCSVGSACEEHHVGTKVLDVFLGKANQSLDTRLRGRGTSIRAQTWRNRGRAGSGQSLKI
jgi:hypothetical protein